MNMQRLFTAVAVAVAAVSLHGWRMIPWVAEPHPPALTAAVLLAAAAAAAAFETLNMRSFISFSLQTLEKVGRAGVEGACVLRNM